MKQLVVFIIVLALVATGAAAALLFLGVAPAQKKS